MAELPIDHAARARERSRERGMISVQEPSVRISKILLAGPGGEDDPELVEPEDFYDQQFPRLAKGQSLQKAQGSTILTEADQGFTATDVITGLIEPPYNPDRLMWLKEISPIHSSAIEQMAADIAGNGWRWESAKRKGAPLIAQPGEDSQVQELEDFFENLTEQTFEELLANVADDYKTLNYAGIEILRNPVTQKIEDLFWVPGHTLRVHKDGLRAAQRLGAHTTWFKLWNPNNPDNYLASNGTRVGARTVNDDKVANELLFFRKGSGRSWFYGVPKYVAAIGAIFLYTASRDYNVRYFENNAIPAWAVVIEGGELTPQVEKTIQDFFRISIKKNPHRTFVLSVPATSNRPGIPAVKVTFNKLADFHRDGSFIQLKQETDKEILIAHRVPPYRVGWAQLGALGGDVAYDMDKNYRSGVIEPDQRVLESRFNSFFKSEFGLTTHVWKLNDIDIEDSEREIVAMSKGFLVGGYTVDAIRARLGQPLLGFANGGNKVFVNNVFIGTVPEKPGDVTDGPEQLGAKDEGEDEDDPGNEPGGGGD